MNKVLIITYYWPPAGGPGVQRIIKYVKYLPEYGWEPLILTVENPTSPSYDESLLKNLPSTLRVFKTGTYEPFNLYRRLTGQAKSTTLAKDVIIKKPNERWREKIARVIRANLFLPDARIGWMPKMLKKARAIVKAENPSVIFSTSPPHSLQLGARRLAEQSGLKWIADFRDPWIEAYWESGLERLSMMKRFNQKLEQRVLRDADLITTVSEGFRDLFLTKVENRCEILYHGFDRLNDQKYITDTFSIVYLGTMSRYQSPDTFFNAVSQLKEEVKNKIEVIIIGKVFAGFTELLESYPGLNISVRDFLPYDEVMDESRKASMLLLINPKPTYGASLIPAKIYDYLALRKPILAFGIQHGRLQSLLEETESGQLYDSGNENEVQAFILKYFEIWERQQYILLDYHQDLNKYQASYNVKKLASLLNEIKK